MSLQDGIFTEEVENDITLFSKDATRKRVLVFPPVNNYRRFLIHQLVQEKFGDILKTFSIGQGLARRTVVCYQSDIIRDCKLNGVPSKKCDEPANSSRLDSVQSAMGVEERRSPSESREFSRMRQVKSTPAVEIYRPPPARRAGRNGPATCAVITTTAETSSASAKANRQRRPDRAVYVPKHRRSTETDDVLPHNPGEIVSSIRPRFNRPGIIAPCENCSSREPTSPHHLHGNTQSSCESWNKENSSSSSSSSSSSFVESSNKNYARFDHDSNKVNLPEDDLNDMETEDDAVDAECYESFGKISEGAEFFSTNHEIPTNNTQICFPAKSEVFMNNTQMRLSASSDESIDAAMKQSKLCSTVSDLIGNVSTSNAAGTNDDECFLRESPASSLRNSRENKIENLTSVHCNDETNMKNLETLRSRGVENVLIISEPKPRESEGKNVEIEKQADNVATSPPEKKPKKVARAKSKPASPPSPPIKLNRDECDWDSLFDDNGECLDPTLIEELTAAVGEVTIQQPKMDYKAFSRPVETSNEEFGHVVEIYNFPSDFKTSDLAAVFSTWKNGGFELKWVDDTHCLGVFSSSLVAAEVLSSDHPFVKTRPLSAATALSKTKARKSAEFLQPYKSRPETCAALARRLVTGALGVKLATARQEREQEKVLLREAKEKKRLANKQREDVWEGIIAEK